MHNDEQPIYVTKASMPSYEEYIEEIKPLWESHWITNMGKYHKQLERQVADYLNVPEVSLMVNGHMALELAILSFEFPFGGEVITTPFTFISTTHAIVRNNLLPVFCDVKESDGTIDETKIEDLITEKTVAIVPVHVYGNICNVEKIQSIADKYNLKVIYDAAHAFGETLNGIGIGNFGDASIFSFHATKVFNTVEGGAVVCKDHSLYEKLYDLKNFGIRSEELVASIGANAKMNEFNAIMGLCNLRHISDVIASRGDVVRKYTEAFSDLKGLRMLKNGNLSNDNFAYFPVCVTDESGCSRDELYNSLRDKNIFARKYFYPLTSDQACFKNKYKKADLTVARRLASQVLALPLFAGMTDCQIERVIEGVKGS